MFERLFKFSQLQFAESEIGMQAGPWLVVAAVILGGLLVAFGIIYAITNRYTSNRVRAVSFGLRGVVLLLLCLPLFEPVLITPDVVPDENFVAVVVDASASMTIPDGTLGTTRMDDVAQVLFDDDGLLDALDDHFKLRYYLFDDAARRADTLSSPNAEGASTNLSAALERVLDDFRGLPLRSVVLLTDGGDNSNAVPRNQAEALRSREVPLYVVGTGQQRFAQEREILDVTVSKAVEATTGAEIDVKVRSWGEEPQPVEFRVLDGETILHTETRRLKGDGLVDQFTIFFEPPAPGAQEYRLEMAAATGELNTTNNALPMLVDTRRDTLRVLYFEGHLRQEFKFIKRSLEDDQVVEFTSVARTGTGKVYRQGIRSPEELAGGFPEDEAELYDFKALILGDIEAAHFRPDQLRMIEDFVRVRGGGFLMLGGRRSFADGDYNNTPIASVLPVTLDPSRRTILPAQFSLPNQTPEEQGFQFLPTATGLESPILKLSANEDENRRGWSDVPGLTSINYLGAIKPGAVVLAEKPTDDFGAGEPLLAVQRYGRGRSAALATASTWRWQMLLDADDVRHERFWRQLMRWLVASAPTPVTIDLGPRHFAPGDDIPVALTVFDAQYLPYVGADVEAYVTSPSGVIRELEVREELTQTGSYVASFSTAEQGLHTVYAVARTEDGTMLGEQEEPLLIRPDGREFYDATLKHSFLTDLATTAGGAYYEPAAANAIPEIIRTRRTSTSIYHASYLWDMPLLFGLILLLLSAEWFWRRRKGLP